MASKKRERSVNERRKPEAARRQRAPTVSVIGAGRMGSALALALARCGYLIEAVIARRKSSARRASRLFSTSPLALSSAELDELPSSNILIITTPDDLINETAGRIASMTVDTSARRTALHTSGALSSDELKSLRGAGFHTGSMHPLVAVSDARAGAESLRRAYFCIEGERQGVKTARRIVRDLGARSFSVNTKDKALYHAAAVTASGHMVALFDMAAEMLARCGLGARESRVILMPLVRSALDNLSEHEPARALTGTFARADVETVRRHLDAIRREKMSDALAAYILLGQRSLRLAKKGGANANLLKAIAESLAEAAKD